MKNTITLLVLLCLSFQAAYAGPTVKLTVVVKDAQTGEVLPGVNILIEGTRLGAATDPDGFYVVLNVPPGLYTITARMIGYQTKKIENVRIKVDLTRTLDFTLNQEILGMDEIVVTADRPPIQKDLTSTSSRVSSQDIEAMPVEEMSDVVNLQAGVIDGHFRGGRTGEVAYLLDGLSVVDVYNGAVGIQIENTMIQELEVISGTFNAEYGQAMSGVVNIVTKEAAAKFGGSVSAYFGNYFTTHDDLFPNLQGLDGGRSQNVEVTFNGPVRLIEGLSFFLNGRYYNDDGYMYGKRVYNVSDGDPRDVSPSDPSLDTLAYQATGDGEYVPMNDYQRYSFQGKLSYYVTENFKVNYSLLLDDHTNRYYDHAYGWNPDGISTHYRNNRVHNLILTHTLSNRSFQTLKLSSNNMDYEGHLYEDPYDPRYVAPEQGQPLSDYTYRYGGNQADRYNRITHTNIVQWALRSQANKEHAIGLGVEGRLHKMHNHWRELRNLSEGLLDTLGLPVTELGYTQEGTSYHENYTKYPYEVSAYVQDKMEYGMFIVNAGVRFDYFEPNSSMPADWRNPEDNPNFPGAGEFVEADPKFQFSPRLGCSFPISDEGAIHFAYGHFFQIPRFENLYLNSSFFVEKGRGLYTVTGNPDLEPERRVNYELGVQQVLYPEVVLDFTLYYADIRNLLGVEIIETYDKYQYAKFINRDYGNVRGFVMSLEKRFADHFGATIDYTYQIAEGNSSDPRAVFQDNQTDPPVESEKRVVPLDWDQRSTLNFSLNVGTPDNWNVGLIGRIGSGMPYTRDRQRTIDVRFENDGREPATYVFDLRAEKELRIWGANVTTFLLIYNLLDRKNEYSVYATTGRATYDLNVLYAGEVIGLNTIDEYIADPSMYSAPREIRLGFRFGL